jgi:hypothetical protein
MIPNQKKKAVSMILGMGPESEPMEEGGDEFEAIAGDALAAFESKDKAALASALKAFFYACEAGE